MDIELIEIRDFLAAHHPFDVLPLEELGKLAHAVEIQYARAGTEIMTPGVAVEHLYLVRTGAIETHSPKGELLARLCEGEICGIRALLAGNGTAVNRSQTIEDSLLYRIPRERFDALRETYQAIDYFFAARSGGRMAAAGPSDEEELNLMSIRLSDMVTRAPVTITADSTVQDAALCMRENRVSSVLISSDGNALDGIFTDRDLRNRVVAEGLPYDTKLAEVMTPDPMRIESDKYAFDALLVMSRHNIRHLPVVTKGQLAGCISTTNLVQTQTTSAIYLVGDIHKQENAEGLAGVLAKIPDLVQHLADAGATAHNIGHIVSALTDAATVRLLQLAEDKLGPAPVPYAWAAAGSQGRHEQTAQSDQDNCLIMDDTYDQAAHGAYFKDLARFVNDGLNTCGYVYCPGEMMAMTDKWRQPLKTWKSYFNGWIDQPEPKALMLSCIFFDLRFIHGKESLFTELQDLILEKTKKNNIFQAYMAGNAMTHQPPIGFFRNFVLIRGGEHDHTLDLKHTGVVPITDLARVYALAAGIRAVNTQDRLSQAAEAKVITATSAMDLRDALEFISLTRLRHQARQISGGKKADNFMVPDELSSFERTHLKDAFGVVKTMQAAMANTYQTSRF